MRLETSEGKSVKKGARLNFRTNQIN
jgi:hypothetical protein